MQPFDFLADTGLDCYSNPAEISRLNKRHEFIIDPNLEYIHNAAVLDLGAHDGRWPYALAQAGAASVLGIEGRPDVIQRFDRFPVTDAKLKVTLRAQDIMEAVDQCLNEHRHFDVITVLGVFYHIMDHFTLLKKLCALKPQIIIFDSALNLSPQPIVYLVAEDSSWHLAATPQEGVNPQRTPVGYCSCSAVELMANTLGWEVKWEDWNRVPEAGRESYINDYYRSGKPRRFTFTMQPR